MKKWRVYMIKRFAVEVVAETEFDAQEAADLGEDHFTLRSISIEVEECHEDT